MEVRDDGDDDDNDLDLCTLKRVDGNAICIFCIYLGFYTFSIKAKILNSKVHCSKIE